MDDKIVGCHTASSTILGSIPLSSLCMCSPLNLPTHFPFISPAFDYSSLNSLPLIPNKCYESMLGSTKCEYVDQALWISG